MRVQPRLFLFVALCAAMFAATFEARAQQSSQPSETIEAHSERLTTE